MKLFLITFIPYLMCWLFSGTWLLGMFNAFSAQLCNTLQYLLDLVGTCAEFDPNVGAVPRLETANKLQLLTDLTDLTLANGSNGRLHLYLPSYSVGSLHNRSENSCSWPTQEPKKDEVQVVQVPSQHCRINERTQPSSLHVGGHWMRCRVFLHEYETALWGHPGHPWTKLQLSECLP